MSSEIVRDSAGRFPKGVSGNPRGKPPLPKEFTDTAPECLAVIAKMALDQMTDKDGNHVPTEPKLRLQAAERVVERVYGKVDSKMEVAVGVDAAGGTCLQVSFVAADKKTNDDEV
jgi:hypothetical protein